MWVHFTKFWIQAWIQVRFRSLVQRYRPLEVKNIPTFVVPDTAKRTSQEKLYAHTVRPTWTVQGPFSQPGRVVPAENKWRDLNFPSTVSCSPEDHFYALLPGADPGPWGLGAEPPIGFPRLVLRCQLSSLKLVDFCQMLKLNHTQSEDTLCLNPGPTFSGLCEEQSSQIHPSSANSGGSETLSVFQASDPQEFN